MKRVTHMASYLGQPMNLAKGVFAVSTVFVVVALVRRMSELATDWRLGGSWNIDVSHVLGLFVALAFLLAAIVGACRRGRV